MNLGTIEKAAADVLDYDVDYGRWLPTGDTVASAAATVTDATIDVDSVDVSDDRVKVWLSAGLEGDDGTLTVIATTTQGRTIEVCLRLRVKGC